MCLFSLFSESVSLWRRLRHSSWNISDFPFHFQDFVGLRIPWWIEQLANKEFHFASAIGLTCYQTLCISNDCSTIEEVPFLFEAACKFCLIWYSPKHTVQYFSDMTFCEFFKYKTKTTGCLQYYYTTNYSLTTKVLLFMLKVAKQLQPTIPYMCTNLSCILFASMHMWQHNSGHVDHILHTKWLLYSQQCFISQKREILKLQFKCEINSNGCVYLKYTQALNPGESFALRCLLKMCPGYVQEWLTYLILFC